MGPGLARLVVAAVMAGTAACAAPLDPEEPTDDERAEAAQTSGVAPSDPQATAATRTVYANLHSFDMGSVDPFDHRVLLGQQEADTSNRRDNGIVPVPSDLQAVAGRPAALVSYELSHAYKTSLSAFDAAGFRAGRGALRERILDQHRHGALVSLVWHLRCPKRSVSDRDLFGADDCPADYRLAELLQRKPDGTKGAHADEWRAMLDELAELLWSLKDDRGELVPVQIRPFHELTGGWFWWGADDNDPDDYAAVWREMVDYLRRGRGLHNALWVFCPASPSSEGRFDRFYPGDAYVDVVAFDRYDFGDGRFARGYEADLRTVDAFARAHGKVAAVAEVGRELTRYATDPTWFTAEMLAPLKAPGRKIAYVALWRNAPWEKFVPEPNDGAIADDFELMANDDAVLLRGEHDLYRPLHVP